MKKLKYPPYMQWEVTPRCNHNCIHCYNYWRSNDDKMIENKFYDDIVTNIILVHPVSVVITGGEPLLVFNEIKDQLVRLLDNGISISINTNAALVNDDITEFLRKYKIPVFVSLPCADEKICDSITNRKGSFRRTTSGIKKLRDAGISVTVNMVVMKSNINYIYETARFVVEELNVNSFFASRVGKPINSKDSFDIELLDIIDLNKIELELLKIKKDFNIRIGTAGPIPACSIEDFDCFQEFAYKKGCSAGQTTYSIDCNGNIKACPRDNKIYGNILNDNFADVWDKMSEWRNDSLLPIECKTCTKKEQCGGGCRLDSLPFTKKRNALDTMAKIDNLPIRFEKVVLKNDISISEKFFVPTTLLFVEEDFGWRVNNFGKTLYITQEMKEFLENNSDFTLEDFIKEYDLDFETAKSVIELLLKNNLLYNSNIYNKIKEEVNN